MSDSTTLTLVGLMIALAAGLLGIFVVSRRMSLVADALSHVSLPGVSLALRFGFDSFFGALGVLIFAVLVNPAYQDIQQLRGELAAKSQLFQTQSEQFTQVQNLIAQFAKFIAPWFA